MSRGREREAAPGGRAADLTVVVVHYHAASELAEAVRAMGRDLEGSGLDAEWRIVDNGSDEAERRQLAALDLPIVDGGGNLGFAAGVNRGVAAAGAGRFCVLNPDVEVLPGCARALLDELDAGAGAAAPRLYWDRRRRYLLPPGEERSRRWELMALAARRRPIRAAQARARWRRDARRHWRATSSIPSTRLSGAVLALSRAAWDRVGPFDEGYRLYFEETDWLLRLERAGLEARQSARAEAIHSFARSTKDEPMAATWFAESARRFRALHYGRWFAWLYDRVAAAPLRDDSRPPALLPWRADALAAAAPPRAALRSFDDAERLWIELSPNREGFPAAGAPLDAEELAGWTPPYALMRASGIAGMSLCLTSEGGRELGRWWVDA